MHQSIFRSRSRAFCPQASCQQASHFLHTYYRFSFSAAVLQSIQYFPSMTNHWCFHCINQRRPKTTQSQTMTEVSPPSSLAQAPLLPYSSYTTTGKENIGGEQDVVVVSSTNVVNQQHPADKDKTNVKSSSTDQATTTTTTTLESILLAAAVPPSPSPPSLDQYGHLPPPPPPPQELHREQQQQVPSPAVVLLTDTMPEQEQHNEVKSNDSTTTTTTTTTSDTTAAASTTTSTTVEEHLERLRREFSDLLLDTVGDERMAFLPCPDAVTLLLSEAWNKGTGAIPTATTKKDANRLRQVVDRVDRKLKAVQSFFPNLLNYALTSPGFPSVASGADDGAIFQSFGSRVQEAQDILTAMLHQQLVDMQHADYTQRIIFYLSFLKSKDYMLQDAHIDYQWPTVDPFREDKDDGVVNYCEDDDDDGDGEDYGDGEDIEQQQQQQQKEDDNVVSSASAGASRKRKKTTTSRRVTMTSSSDSSNSTSRSNRRTVSCRRNSSTTRGQNRLKRQTYKKRVPFIALFPLTEAGMTIEIWKARGPDHKPTSTTTTTKATTTTTGDNKNVAADTTTTTTSTIEEQQQLQQAGGGADKQEKEDCGKIVHLPFGTMALMRGDILHAGGFINNEKTGDPRAHLYVYRDDGELHDLNIKNSYDVPRTKLTQWAAATMTAATAAGPAAPTTTAVTDSGESNTATGPVMAAAAAAARRPSMMMMMQSPFPSQMKAKHRNKTIVPFSHLYRHHPERLARAERMRIEQQRARAIALAAKEAVKET
jgi:hypothetical protein